MDSSVVRKIDTRIDNLPVKDREVAPPPEKKADPSAAETMLRELKEKNRMFNKLKKQGLIAKEDVQEIQKDLRNTIKELKNILDSLPEIKEV